MSMEAEASNQVMSMTLEGVKITAELTGKATKEMVIALFAAIRSVAQNYKSKKQITPGQKKLITMLQSGKPLNQFVISNDKLDFLSTEAKKRGVTFSAIKNKKEGIAYITVYQQDAARINRLLEDIGVGDVDFVNMNTEPDTPTVADEAETRTKDTAHAQENVATETDQSSNNISTMVKSVEMSDKEIDDVFEALEPIESEGDNPLSQAAKDNEIQLETSSPLMQTETDSKSEQMSKQPHQSNDNTLYENFVNNNPSKRPSVKQKVDEIIRQQQADKSAKSPQVAQKITEAANNITKDMKEVFNK